ncbi:protease HtpX [Oleiagrimonas sp. C23AA]|uniref:protease HtpX n=1 Tax=Oleiagrimonas sp. C23AA TaxID=2719047 RepID=UPI001422BDF6|nr:protease HtpX [Oleiagrimonas sp. C23AA]NII10266.1 protease HtpX [Oleiagrimonas sp. C23AA]
MRRIVLFVLTNLAVLVLLSIVCRLFGIDAWAASRGYGGLGPLLVFAAVIGFGGSLISLAMSKWMAKMSTGARVIEQPSNEAERWLLATVREHATQAGIGMPEVAIYDGPEMNAFATGASRNKALVAVSTGLLHNMDRDQVSAVLGHEVGHVANGDMVTMALLQGVLNTFVIFLARIVGRMVDSWISGSRDDREGGTGLGYFIIVMVLEVIFGLLASIVVMGFSRYREFRADAAGARLAGRDKMISALRRLSASYGESTLPKQIQAFGISGHLAHGAKRLFMSHPPLEERIARLERAGA